MLSGPNAVRNARLFGFRPRGVRPTLGRTMWLIAAAAMLVAAWPAATGAAPRCDGELAGYRVKGKIVHGDVDGDGRADRVTLRVDRRRPRACRHVLVVRTASGRLAAPVKPLPWPGTAPRLMQVAEIDGRDGVEPVVTLSPANVYRPGAVFAARGDGLVRLRLGRSNLFPLDDEFPTGVDCTGEPGRIEVITSRVAEDDSFWDVKRSIYRARGRRFRRLSTERSRVPVGTEITGPAFRSCPARSTD